MKDWKIKIKRKWKMLYRTGKILKQLFWKQQKKPYRCNKEQPTKNGGMRNAGRQ
jgi:hypothetical protein